MLNVQTPLEMKLSELKNLPASDTFVIMEELYFIVGNAKSNNALTIDLWPNHIYDLGTMGTIGAWTGISGFQWNSPPPPARRRLTQCKI